MDNFANASFQPDLVALMDTALASAVEKLPHPVSSAHVQAIAQTILRSTQEGERNVVALETMALRIAARFACDLAPKSPTTKSRQ